MGATTESFDLLSGVKNVQTPLFLTLMGFRRTISKHLGLKNLPWITHDNHKAVLKREQTSQYPYGYFRLTSMGILRDQTLIKAVKRHGSAMALDELTNSTLTKAYMFPATLGIEFHFLHNDPAKTLLLMEKAAIMGAVDSFTFCVTMPGAGEWVVGVKMDEGPVSFPTSELESESNPQEFDITFNFELSTKLGIVKDVPKVNNEGTVSRSIGVDGEGGATESF